MGVPKFFRWMSERYPAISQLIAENRIPEFDCLYLDMNGIIHNCSHSDSDSVTHRVTEDEIFIKIFNYIEHLFGKIKPQQLFFMAIDGVAPRAKMNQQRARRFRTARDAEEARNKAIAQGTEMPKEDAFDSNCITPGTDFMARLTQQLKYFVAKKVSEDSDWQGCEVVLSGHEVPGEGEHKIMEYIRQSKSQPNYDANRRHCLYGLDADLIMLGLLSHDPHFCLLREEVTFGRQSKAKSKELEHQNFYLMQLCIVREYLELEFQELKQPGALAGAEFNMERIIDDFILMAFFVGNDFLPNLPHLHINEGALSLMFGVYKQVLPKAGGYINEGGVINMQRLGLLLDELSHVEYRFFEHDNQDASWLKDKSVEKKEDVMQKVKRKGNIVMTTRQKELYQNIKRYVNSRAAAGGDVVPLDLPSTLRAEDRAFVEDLANNLHLQCRSLVDGDGNRHLHLTFPDKAEADNSEDEDDEEAQNALLRIFKQYDRAKIEDLSAEDAQNKAQAKYDAKFVEWKDKHYKAKFDWGLENEAELTKLTENYVQGLQWVLFYYYRGVASWPWYYQYHYSPMISDVKKGLKANIDFKLGQPFRPFQQLMGVLPDRSKKIVPQVYWPLMTDPSSPIIDFYPRDFELDMNGKKQDWEAVVKIPFIEEQRLLAAMAPKDAMLSENEKQRNSFGVSLKFTYAPELSYTYPSSLPGIFPDLENCKCVENIFELPTMEGLDVYVGLVKGVKLGEAALAGFPSLRTLPTTGSLGFHGVSVFQQESRNESMVVTLMEGEDKNNIAIAQQKLGKAVHVGYPFLQEGKVMSVQDELFTYYLADESQPPTAQNIQQVPHPPQGISDFKKKANRIQSVYSKRLGMMIGEVESLVQVDMLTGLMKMDSGATVKQYSQIQGVEPDYATQTVVDEVISEDQRFLEKEALPLEEDFPVQSRAFFLGDMAYGRPLQVMGHQPDERAEVWLSMLLGQEPEFGLQIAQRVERSTPYTPSYQLARQLNLHPLVLSKLTAAFNVQSSGLRLNLGLNLKFDSKKLKVLGYSRKSERGWEYSPKAISLLTEYMTRFPEFIARIEANPTGDEWADTTFYDDPEVAKAKMKEIGAWLKSVETKSFDKVPLDAQQMDSDAVKEVEAASDALNAANISSQGKKVGGVPRMALLKPGDAEQRCAGQRFKNGDRVVYVLETGRVPIAMRGTVVGMTRTARQTLLDVVFDFTFMSGTTLNDRCSPFRGSTVPSNSVLNLTDRQVVTLSKEGKARAPQQQTLPFRPQHGAGTVGGSGIPGQQLRQAGAPPPLRGSFRGAVSGPQANGHPRGGANGFRGGRGGMPNGNAAMPPQQQFQQQPQQNTSGGFNPSANANGFVPRGPSAAARGGRGRGGNRGGFTIVDNSDPTEGVIQNNPSFRPQSYNNVPPPAGLNEPARGRGGRGRGPRGGRGGPRGGRGGPVVNGGPAGAA